MALLREIADMARPVRPARGRLSPRTAATPSGSATPCAWSRRPTARTSASASTSATSSSSRTAKNLEQRLTEACPYLLCREHQRGRRRRDDQDGLEPADPDPRPRQLRRGPRAADAQAAGLHRPGRAPVLRHPRRRPATTSAARWPRWRKLAAPSRRAATAERSETKPAATWPLYVFDNGTGGPDVPFDQQAAMLKELGYDGIAYCGRLPLPRLPEMLKAVDAHGTQDVHGLHGVTSSPSSRRSGQAALRPDPENGHRATQRAERDANLAPHRRRQAAGDQDQDEHVVGVLREIADMADQSGLKVAIYPHINWYAERYEDAIRLAKKVDRKNLGVVFNLSHFMIRDDEHAAGAALARRPGRYLFGVSINGADHGYRYSPGLEAPDPDPRPRRLRRRPRAADARQMGYHGPIGIQCHDMTGDPRENLTHSMAGWRKLLAGLADGQ